MASTRPVAILVLTVAVVGGFTVGGATGLASADGGAVGAPSSAGGEQTATATETNRQTNESVGGDGQSASASQESAACNYTRLYERTIDSVVQVETPGGLGSGFVLRNYDGNDTSIVVTNEHVVGDASQVVVKFSQGDSRVGQVVGATARTDLAVVRVTDTPDYTRALQLARAEPRPGEKVAALGSPYGLEQTMTSGIVSGVGRSIPVQLGQQAQQGEQGPAIPDTVQTDAPINPGNSGGPLVLCSTGRVAGVNRAGGSENIGFAVSADVVRRVVPDILDDGQVAYSFLGVGVTEVTPPVAEANDLNVTEGVMVVDTVAGSPAAEQLRGATGTEEVAGFRVPVGGDVILGVDGAEVETREDLNSYLLSETRPGDTVRLTVLRDGQRRNVTVQLAERPDSETG